MAFTDTEIISITASDGKQLYDVARQADLDESGRVDFSAEDVEWVLTHDTSRAWAVPGPDGSFRAAAWLEQRPHRDHLEGELLLPHQAEPGDGERLLGAILDAVQRDERHRPLHIFSEVHNSDKQGLLVARGGAVVRHFFRMDIDLTDRPAAATAWPAGTSVRALAPGEDLRPMFDVIDTAFQDHWGHTSSTYESWVERNTSHPGHDPSLWWLVLRDGRPVAGAICHVNEEGGYVGALGTLREARGLGLGTALLDTTFEEFARRGATTAGLHVDSTNPTGAVHLYESVGMHVSVHYACYELRP